MTDLQQLYNFLKSKNLITHIRPEYEVKPENLAETPELAIKHKKEHENWINSLTPKNQQDYLKIFGS